MSKILDGKKIQEKLASDMKEEISKLEVKPRLVIVQVGDREESNVYIKYKKKFADKVGALVELERQPEDVLEEHLIRNIEELNIDKSVHGIIVQLPLPEHINVDKVINTIDPKKDVDGLTALNVKGLYDNKEILIPATARGVRLLLEESGVTLSGKKVVVIGRSSLVGKAIALALANRDATVELCGKHTQDLAGEAKRAEVLVVATGAVGLVTEEYVNEDQVVVDVGITAVEKDGKRSVVGDVDFGKVWGRAGAISPVPGGVGPMTIVSIYKNLLDAYHMQVDSEGV